MTDRIVAACLKPYIHLPEAPEDSIPEGWDVQDEESWQALCEEVDWDGYLDYLEAGGNRPSFEGWRISGCPTCSWRHSGTWIEYNYRPIGPVDRCDPDFDRDAGRTVYVHWDDDERKLPW